jgi:hypothetical protein
MRPSSRKQPPARRGDGSAPRSGRPRLSRERVDRAWESGAQRNDPDYHPRSNNGQPPRNKWQQRSPIDRKPFGNSRGNYQQTERNSTYRPNQHNHSRSFESERRTFDEQHGQQRHEYGNKYGREEWGHPDGRSERRGQFQPGESRLPYGPRGTNKSNYRETSRQGDAEERHYGRPPRRFADNERSQNRYEHDNYRSQGRFERDSRGPRRSGRDERPQEGTWRRDARSQQNNWQQESRPPRRYDRSGTGRDNPFMGRKRNYGRNPNEAQFEGDYERFDGYEERNPVANRTAQSKPSRNSHDERTEDREFREEVEKETNSLIAQIKATPKAHEEQAVKRTSHSSRPDKSREAKGAQKSRTRAASAVSRERKQARKGKTAVKVRSTGPKPSQRGFKWPTS